MTATLRGKGKTILLWLLIFPATFVEGQGITTFKIASDYLVSDILLASAVALSRVKERFEREVFTLLLLSIFAAIASELAFHLYVDFYSYNNLVGHYLKIVSFYLFYKAVISVGLFRPYELLFRDLKRNEGSSGPPGTSWRPG